ncbi:MAG TPA: hypothetical protein DGH68_02715, partial [Bacteroidetes bacterium]|nr:hypothetical protein [Bacteroidota bacterium]
YPNPFNPSTTIDIRLPVQSDFSLTIYDILGRSVRTYDYQRVLAGVHKVVWDGKDEAGGQVASGVYLYKLIANENIETRKLILLK